MITADLTPKQLRQAADIKERIETLQKELNAILGGAAGAPAQSAAERTWKRNMSAAGRARIAAAARARWAAYRRAKGTATPTKGRRRNFSAAGRAALSAAAKARWAQARKAGKTRL